MDAKTLARLSLDFRRLGAAAILQRLARSDRPLRVGANGGSEDEGEDLGRGGTKRRRDPGTPQEVLELRQLQPALKKLAEGAEDDPNFARRYGEFLLRLMPEIMEHVLAFLLRPTFLDEHAHIWGGGAENFGRHAGREIHVRLAAFNKLLETADAYESVRPLRDILLSPYIQAQTYLWWLRRAGAPFEAGGAGGRYPGPTFDAEEVAMLRHRLPFVLQLKWRPTWYEHFVANVAVNWHLSELARELWRAGFDDDPEEYIDPEGEEEMEPRTWPGAHPSWHAERIEVGIESMGSDTIRVSLGGPAADFRGPGVSGTEGWDPTWKDEVLRVYDSSEEDFAIIMGRQMRRVTLLRIPSLLWDRTRYPDSDVVPRHFSTHIKFEPTGTGRMAPFLLFDPPVRAYDAKNSRPPWGFTLSRPALVDKPDNLFLTGVRLLSIDNVNRALGRWLRAVRLDRSDLHLEHVTRLIVDRAGPTLYLPARRELDVFVRPDMRLQHLTVTSRPRSWPAILRSESGDALDQRVSITDIKIMFVGRGAETTAALVETDIATATRAQLRTFGETYAPHWAKRWVAEIRGQAEVPAWLAEVKMPYPDAGDDEPAEEEGPSEFARIVLPFLEPRARKPPLGGRRRPPEEGEGL